MKKIILSIIFAVLMTSTIVAQNVARECVLFEVFTGVNCPYCPAAANGIAEMLEEGLSIAPIAYHTNAFSTQEFYTNETNARANYYGINSYPTLKADGKLTKAGGGSASQSMYSNYIGFYNQRIGLDSPFSIDLTYDYKSGTECEVNAVVTQVGDCSSTDVRVFIVLTESHIARAWQGMSEVNFVVRDMIPNQNGTTYTGGTQTVTGTFDMQGYLKENCELVAWVQSYNGDKEVYQAVRLPLTSTALQYDLAILKTEEVVVKSCSGRVAPRFTIKNYGTEALNSVLFRVTDDAGVELTTYLWEGYIPQDGTTDFVFEEIDCNYSSYINIEAVELNGNADEMPFDNIRNIALVTADEIEDGYMKIQIKTGSDPENLLLEVKNMNTNVVDHSFTFEDANKVYTFEIYLQDVACYRVSFKNAKGEGLGGGFFAVKDSNNSTIFSGTSNDFRYELASEFSNQTVSIDEIGVENIKIFPNPATSVVNISVKDLYQVDVYNNIGQLIYTEIVNNDNVVLDTESWGNGLYYIDIETKNGSHLSQKVIVNK